MQTVLKRTGRSAARCARYGKRTARLAAGCPRYGLIAVLRAYKFFISPLLPSACRYRPTCSEYMLEAVAKFGAGKGVWMGLKRLGRCHPFHEGGYDPVN